MVEEASIETEVVIVIVVIEVIEAIEAIEVAEAAEEEDVMTETTCHLVKKKINSLLRR